MKFRCALTKPFPGRGIGYCGCHSEVQRDSHVGRLVLILTFEKVLAVIQIVFGLTVFVVSTSRVVLELGVFFTCAVVRKMFITTISELIHYLLASNRYCFLFTLKFQTSFAEISIVLCSWCNLKNEY